VNGFRCRTSGCIQRAARKSLLDNRRDSHSTPSNNEENTMLRNFTAALIATALVAGPALAAQPSSNAGAAPAAVSAAPADIKGQAAIKHTDARKPVKTVKHARIQARNHVRHARSYGRQHVAQHVTHATKHLAKPGKVTKTNKTVKSPA
jgi:hypothetical protein